MTQEIPETGLGYDDFRGKDPHFVQRSVLFLLGWLFTANNLILLQLKKPTQKLNMH